MQKNTAIGDVLRVLSIFVLGLSLCLITACVPSLDKDLSEARFETKTYKELLAVGDTGIIGLHKEGVVKGTKKVDSSINEWRDVVAISAECENYVALLEDGTVARTPNDARCYSYDTSSWTGIVAAYASEKTIIGLKSDGTVVATGDNGLGQCEVSGWTDVVAIYVTNTNTVGIRSDGTVLYAGQNSGGQKEAVAEWTDVVDVQMYMNGIAGLKVDGTVVYSGHHSSENARILFDVSDWVDIVELSMSQNYLVGLKADGTVVATGDNLGGQCNVIYWDNIVDIETLWEYTVGLDVDGNILISSTAEKNYITYMASDEERAVAIIANDTSSFYLTDKGYIRTISASPNYDNLPTLRPLWETPQDV